MAKYNFSFDVSNLTAYTDEIGQDLMAAAIAEGRTTQIVDIVPNVKGTVALNNLDGGSIVLQSAGCGWNPSGTTVFKQRDLSVSYIKTEEALCPRALESYWLGKKMKAGSAADTIPFESIVIGYKTSQIKEANELLLWQGDTGATNANLAFFDGIWVTLVGETDTVNVPSASSMTYANVDASIRLLVNAIPEELMMRNDLKLFCSYSVFANAVQKYFDGNNFHYDVNTLQKDGRFMLPASPVPVEIIATHGLTGTTNVVLTPASNIVVGTDIANEDSRMDLWYSKDNDEVRIRSAYKLGVNVRFPQYAVINA